MKKVFFRLLVFGALSFGVSFNAEKSFADELSNADIIHEITKERPEYATKENIYAKKKLSQASKELVASFEMRSETNKEYVETLIENLEIRDDITNEEFNSLVTDALKEKENMDLETEKEYQDLLTQYDAEKDESKKVQPRLDPVDLARRAYQAGVILVINTGGRMTANYMQHARVASPFSPAPGTYVSRNDAWAKQIGSAILEKTYGDFKRNGLGKKTYTQRGSHEFTSGDPYWALHWVNYTVSYVQRSNGGYAYTVTVSDLYDFAWGNYNNVAVGFGNNYCFAMQNLRLIKPFNVSIVYTG